VSLPKLQGAHVPTLLYAVGIGLGVLFLYHLIHRKG
jgi:hypothetical protein